MRGEWQRREIGMSWTLFGYTGDGIWSYQFQAFALTSIDEFSVQHELNVVHSLGGFGHV